LSFKFFENFHKSTKDCFKNVLLIR